MPNINIAIIAPPQNPHAMAFVETARMLKEGLVRMGASTEIITNQLDARRFTVMLGAHFLHPDALASLQTGCALFNLEQLSAHQDDAKGKPYFDSLTRLPVIDYTPQNIEFIRQRLVNGRCVHLPFFFADGLADIPQEKEDIDILFFGSLNDRRRQVIDALKAQGLRVETLFGVYGRERNAYIARAKLVLNLHFYTTAIFEEVRVSYLLNNRKAVVAEIGPNTTVAEDLRQAVCGVNYGQLANACVHLLQNDDERHALAERGQIILRARQPSGALYQIMQWANDYELSVSQTPSHS